MPPTVTTEDKFDFILTCLKYSDSIEPDFHAVAAEKNLSTANIAQKGFKKYIEESGKYKLVNRKVVLNDGSASTPTTPAKRGSKNADKDETPKKRKVAVKKEAVNKEEADGEDQDSDDEVVG